jgi:hypothetical protein
MLTNACASGINCITSGRALWRLPPSVGRGGHSHRGQRSRPRSVFDRYRQRRRRSRGPPKRRRLPGPFRAMPRQHAFSHGVACSEPPVWTREATRGDGSTEFERLKISTADGARNGLPSTSTSWIESMAHRSRELVATAGRTRARLGAQSNLVLVRVGGRRGAGGHLHGRLGIFTAAGRGERSQKGRLSISQCGG